MWIYRSPVGILKIVRQPDGRYGLFYGDFCGGLYYSPVAAADDVYTRSSGINEWDLRPGDDTDAPIDLSEWEKV